MKTFFDFRFFYEKFKKTQFFDKNSANSRIFWLEFTPKKSLALNIQFSSKNPRKTAQNPKISNIPTWLRMNCVICENQEHITSHNQFRCMLYMMTKLRTNVQVQLTALCSRSLRLRSFSVSRRLSVSNFSELAGKSENFIEKFDVCCISAVFRVSWS